MTTNAEMILCIVNQGFEEKVIQAANTIGITGGTFLNAHGLSKLDAEKFFGISIQPEKQIVMMVVSADKKADILSVLYDQVGLGNDAQGIAFSIPVDDMSDNLKKQLFPSNK
jgi:hypothetical protein